MRKAEKMLMVMEALGQPKSIYEVAAAMEMTLPTVASTIEELMQEKCIVVDDTSSSVAEVYKHSHAYALSDLRARLLPHRDPVREGHEYFDYYQHQMAARYRRPTLRDVPTHDIES